MASSQGTRFSLTLALVFPAIVGAALALAYYAYRFADGLVQSTAADMREDSRAAAERVIAKMEKRIDDADLDLFQQVEIDDDGAFGPARPVKPPHGIEAYVILNADKKPLGPKGQPVTPDRAAAGFASYRAYLDWTSLTAWEPPGNFRHLHRFVDRDWVLVAYARKKTPSGHDYYVAAKVDLDVVSSEWMPELLREANVNRRLAVVDLNGSAFYGKALPQVDNQFLWEGPFGKTLYQWRVQVAPLDVEERQAQAAKQRKFGKLLIPAAVGVIAVGLLAVWLAVGAERRASRLKSDFIANVSHELKTPLSLIRMFGELIATGRHKGEGTAKDYAGIITRESERLSHLIDNVLDFARLERGKASYDFAEGRLEEVVERGLDVCRYRLEKEKLRLVTEIDADLPPVRMDENAMTLALLNLVDNAVKYGAEGGEVTVALTRAPGGVVLEVRDKGPGIARDEQRRVFERFYRARLARERNVRGSGIGLALVAHIAEAHGGRIELLSEPGQGATFRLFLPAAPVMVATPVPVSPVPAAGEGRP